MADPNDPSHAPVILPLVAGPRPTWIPARRVVDAAVGLVERGTDGGGSARHRTGRECSVTIDVPGAHVIHADPDLLTAMLGQLVDRARRATDAAVGVGLHEVVVTSVLLPDAIELEVADSGPSPSAVDRAWLERQADTARRLGGTLDVRACPEGGTAVTLRFPRRLTERRAA